MSKNNRNTAPKFWNVISNEGTDFAELTLYGDVVESTPRDWWTGEELDGQYITPAGFAEDLERVKDKAEIVIKINSGGGDLYTAIAIHNALRALPAHKTVIVDGIAASAASVIMCAGDTVQVYPGSLVMIHGVKAYTSGYMDIFDVRKMARAFDAAEAAMAEIYTRKTGLSTEEVRRMMNAETWMTGQQAIDQGFADDLLDEQPITAKLSADRSFLFVAGIGHDIRGCTNIPKYIPIDSTAASVTASEKNKEKEDIPMTEQELREQQPDLVAQIEAKAVASAKQDAAAAERARIREIEAIEAQIADKEMVAAAKYGDQPMDAATLALLAMKKAAAQGSKVVSDLNADANESGAEAIKPQANSGYGENKNPLEDTIKGGTQLYKDMKKGGQK